LEAVCDEHGTSGSGESCVNNDAHLDCNNVLYHEASGGKYMPRVVLFDLELGVISALALSRRLSVYFSTRITSRAVRAEKNWDKGH
jgi:tubulin beta